MKMNNLEKLLVEELKDLYSAEKQITEALPKMVDKAEAPALRQAFEDHLQKTESHLQRLEYAFDGLEVEDREKHCKGMQCLIEEGEEIASEATDANTRDAALIAAAQRVEHYEIAGYGTVVSYAHELERHDIAEHLQTTLREEKEADMLLIQIAENEVNHEAL